ncbi:MAG: glucose-1-phosphate thymidylyltransferase [Deinococcota bacterium]
MKGLILAAGLGTRLRPLTSLRPKPIINVANKPIIVHAIDNLVEAGITEIGVVISHATVDYIKDTLSHYKGASFTYLMQDPPKGLAHAVSVARDFLADDPFVMYLGDNLFEHGITSFVDAFKQGDVNAVLALVHVADPRSFGVAVVEDGRVVSLVEKPKDPPSDLAVAGIYVFDKSVHKIIETLEPSARGEYEMTDAIQGLIDKGLTVTPLETSGWWKDTGKPNELLDANRLMLQKLEDSHIEGHLENTEIIGSVVVAQGASLKNSKVVGPVVIGEGTVIEDAYVGPYTSIGDSVEIRDAELEYSVVERGSKITSVQHRIQSSLIGVQVEVKGRTARPSALQIILGDKSSAIIPE